MCCRQDAFTLDVLEVPQGSGSGFVWDKSGHIVTNFPPSALLIFCFPFHSLQNVAIRQQREDCILVPGRRFTVAIHRVVKKVVVFAARQRITTRCTVT